MAGSRIKETEKYVVVFNILQLQGTDFYLPYPVICEKGPDGSPGYMKAAAHPENFRTYFSDPEPHTVQMVEHAWDMSVQSLETSLNKGKKKPLPLQAYLDNKDTGKTVQSIYNRRSARFYEGVLTYHPYLCMDLQRKIRASEIMLSFARKPLVPKLKLTRTQTGIKYEMRLTEGPEEINVYGRDVHILQDDPGIIVMDGTVLQIADLNAVKLKPFIKNEYVFIPEKLIRDYFNKFIAEIIGKAETEAVGFKMEHHDTPDRINLSFVFDIFENRWTGIIRYIFNDAVITSLDRGKRKVRIGFSEENDPYVNEYTLTDETESVAASHLLTCSLNYSDGRVTSGTGQFDLLHSVGECWSALREHFDISPPEINGRQYHFGKLTVEPDFSAANDWFDLNGIVRIGEEEYPISMLFAKIRNDDPYFITPDGRCVIIPEEIMTKYSTICRYATDDELAWRLPKMHYTLLGENTLLEPRSLTLAASDRNYVPSPGLMTTLRPYQWEGVKWLLNHRDNGLGACLADDMGLGKTLQTIAVLLDTKDRMAPVKSDDPASGTQLDLFSGSGGYKRTSLRALIVLPASLVFNWHQELRKFAPSLQAVSYTGPARNRLHRTLEAFDVILTTYQTAVSDFNILSGIDFSYIVLDESQQIRNRDTKVFRTLHQLKAANRLTLSGTPMENSLADLWSQMEFINPSILGSYAFFRNTYQLPVEKTQDQDLIRELRTLVMPYILRRTKEEVAGDLPPLSQLVHYSEMSDAQSKAYEKERSAARNALLGLDRSSAGFRFHVLASISRLRQIANHPVLADSGYLSDSGKFEDIVSQVRTIVQAGHKVLLFSSFIKHLDIIANWLENSDVPYVSLTGQMSAEERERSVTRFQAEEGIRVFLLSIKAGGTGLNLTRADYIFILEPWWNPFVEKQAVARAHRIGRRNPVIVKRFISTGSIEERILNLQKTKLEISGHIIENDDPVFLENADLEQLLE